MAFASSQLNSSIVAAFFLLLLSAVSACGNKVEEKSTPAHISRADSLPPDYIEWVYKDEYAKRFVQECKKSRAKTAKGICEQLLYAERAKQVWAAQAFDDQNASVSTEDLDSGGTYQMSKELEVPTIMAASKFVPNKFYKDEPWITLADIYKLSEKERMQVEAAITRNNTKSYNPITKNIETAFPEE